MDFEKFPDFREKETPMNHEQFTAKLNIVYFL